jgi:hypothetical protein
VLYHPEPVLPCRTSGCWIFCLLSPPHGPVLPSTPAPPLTALNAFSGILSEGTYVAPLVGHLPRRWAMLPLPAVQIPVPDLLLSKPGLKPVSGPSGTQPQPTVLPSLLLWKEKEGFPTRLLASYRRQPAALLS